MAIDDNNSTQAIKPVKSEISAQEHDSEHATKDGTKKYFARLEKAGVPIPHTSSLASLTISRVGFGTYRVHEFEPQHRSSLTQALPSGCNLIDTSGNYMFGSSERLVGDVLKDLFEEKKLRRDEVVVISKAGYIQGDLLKNAIQRKDQGRLWPEVTNMSADAWHCIHPEFLKEQITESLSRLRLQSLDGLLLHNPEYYLKSAHLKDQSRDEFYRRLEQAFRYLEQEVLEKRIQFYGISSNTLPVPESQTDHTSLERISEIAAKIGKSNHFKVVQFPLNLFESGGALWPNNDRKSVLDYAKEKGLAVLINRPFNSFNRDRIFRLTSYQVDPVEAKGEYHQLISLALELERQAVGYPKSHEGLRWAHAIRQSFNDMDDHLTWKTLLANKIMPSVKSGLGRVPREQEDWKFEYQQILEKLLKSVTKNLEAVAEERSSNLLKQLIAHEPKLKNAPTLSSAVTRIYQSLEGVSSMLVGMRSLEYVEDVMTSRELIDPKAALGLLDRFQKHKGNGDLS
jgi:aryl-alcohol dehydrogenase-like predicted oxidoreductase